MPMNVTLEGRLVYCAAWVPPPGGVSTYRVTSAPPSCHSDVVYKYDGSRLRIIQGRPFPRADVVMICLPVARRHWNRPMSSSVRFAILHHAVRRGGSTARHAHTPCRFIYDELGTGCLALGPSKPSRRSGDWADENATVCPNRQAFGP